MKIDSGPVTIISVEVRGVQRLALSLGSLDCLLAVAGECKRAFSNGSKECSADSLICAIFAGDRSPSKVSQEAKGI